MKIPIRTKIFLVFYSFISIIVLALLINIINLRSHIYHDEVNEAAVRLSMLIQQVAVEVTAAEREVNPDIFDAVPEVSEKIEELFSLEKNQSHLSTYFVRPVMMDERFMAELQAIKSGWADFQYEWNDHLGIDANSPEHNPSQQRVFTKILSLLEKSSSFAELLQDRERAVHETQISLQFIFLFLGCMVMIVGGIILRSSFVLPLGLLDQAVKRMGEGQIDEPIKLTGDDELGRLAQSFEKMRQEVSGSQHILEHRVEERTRVLQVAFEFSQEIVKEQNPQTLMNIAAQRVKEMLNASQAHICLVAEDNNCFEIRAQSSNLDHEVLSPLPADGLPPEVMENIINPTEEVEAICRNHKRIMQKNCLSAPLVVNKQTLGAICVVREANSEFADIEKQTLTMLANAVAVAVCNIRLTQEARFQAEKSAAMNERQRLISELHDEASQTLSLLNLRTELFMNKSCVQENKESLDEIMHLKSLIEKAQAQMRMVFSGISSPIVQKPNALSKELEEYLNEFRKLLDVPVTLTIRSLENVSITPLVQKQAVYIYREGLTNARRYAQAEHIFVNLEYVNNGILIQVVDDGVGFDPNLIRSDHHLGLSILQVRTERVGGTLSIETAPGKGTTISAWLPAVQQISNLSNQEFG